MKRKLKKIEENSLGILKDIKIISYYYIDNEY